MWGDRICLWQLPFPLFCTRVKGNPDTPCVWPKKRLQATPLIQVQAVFGEDAEYISKKWSWAASKGAFPGATEKFSPQQHLTAKCLWPELPTRSHFSSSPFPAALGGKTTSQHVWNIYNYIWQLFVEYNYVSLSSAWTVYSIILPIVLSTKGISCCDDLYTWVRIF